jgi:hypothetical protein
MKIKIERTTFNNIIKQQEQQLQQEIEEEYESLKEGNK